MEFLTKLVQAASAGENAQLAEIIATQTTIGAKLDAIIQEEKVTQDQENQLVAAVAQVKQDTTDMSGRVDTIITNLTALSSDDPIIGQAINDLTAESATLKGFHANTPIPPTP